MRCTPTRAGMLLLPIIELLLALRAELRFRVRELGLRFGPATSLRVLGLPFHRFVSRPATVLFLSHKAWDSRCLLRVRRNEKVVCVEGIISAENTKIAQRCLCSEEPAHAVNASSGRSRRRAEVDAFDRSSIHVPVGPQKHLQRSGSSTTDVSSDKICILAFEIGRRAHVASENALVESRREPLDLRFDPRQHVER